MLYSLNDNILENASLDELSFNNKKSFICSISFSELNEINSKININEKVINDCLNGRTTKFESYEGLDYISLKIPAINDILLPSKKLCLILKENLLLFISNDDSYIKEIITSYKNGEIRFTNIDKVLYVFFDKLTSQDAYYIDNLEQEIIELEDGLLTSRNDNYLNKIIILRKKLLKLKRYYERVLNIAEAIEENENDLIDDKSIKYFKMFTNRVNRLYQGVNNLRDYVTQVREAYQAQVDINQNNLMKLFTVVTTIFLPLTLIVGWYGMNFKMPEYNWDYSYPVFIIVCVIIIILCITWFRKKEMDLKN